MSKYFLGILALLTGCAVFLGIEWRATVSLPRHDVIHAVPLQEKVVALTFDDGPHPVYTRQLLDILAKYHVRATFFMIGSLMRQYPETVQAVLAKGHALGNHTNRHPRNLAACSDRRISREIAACQAVIARFTGKKAAIFRPPRGMYDQRVLAIARKKGLQTVLWSICGNRRQANNPSLIARRVLTHIRSGGIILLHDGRYDCRWQDVEATQLIVANLLRRGYRFVTIPQLLAMEKTQPEDFARVVRKFAESLHRVTDRLFLRLFAARM